MALDTSPSEPILHSSAASGGSNYGDICFTHPAICVQFGIMMLLGNGTYVNMANVASTFKLTFQQVSICNSE